MGFVCVCVSCVFLFLLFFVVSLFDCFLKREGKKKKTNGMELVKWGSGESWQRGNHTGYVA